jgi:hypothetical protein
MLKEQRGDALFAHVFVAVPSACFPEQARIYLSSGNHTIARKEEMPSLSEYMAQYDHEHTNTGNKALHAIGIPMVIAGIVLLCITWWRIGLALFVGGWILLFAGHRIEGNKPAFFQGVIYFLVGPIWVAKEIKDAITGPSHKSAAQ